MTTPAMTYADITDLLCDLSEEAPTGYKLNGEATWLQIPDEIPLMAPFDRSCMGPTDPNDESDIRSIFYQLLAEYGMRTFAYHMYVAAQLNFMIESYTSELMELAIEVWADPHNERLGRPHGKINQYQQGCRGPLCRLANREQTRAKSNALPKDPALENALAWMRLSYLQYLQYAKMLRYTRRTHELKPGFPASQRRWQNVTIQQTILMDCVNEPRLHNMPQVKVEV